MQNTTLSRKEREKLTRQQEILAAARELFLRKGYHEATLEEIAQHAQFGKGTIYNYFSSKDDLFTAISQQLLGELEAMARIAAVESPGDCRQRFGNYARLVLRHTRDNADVISLVMRRAHHHDSSGPAQRTNHISQCMTAIWTILSEPLRQEQAAGRLCSIDPLELAIIFDGMIRTWYFHRLREQQIIGPQEIEEAAAQLVTIFFDGVARGAQR